MNLDEDAITRERLARMVTNDCWTASAILAAHYMSCAVMAHDLYELTTRFRFQKPPVEVEDLADLLRRKLLEEQRKAFGIALMPLE